MEADAAGVDPNLPGFHHLVMNATTTNKEGETARILDGYTSYRSFQRLLQIKGDPDTDEELRREQAAADKTRRAAASSINPLDDVLLQTTPDAGTDCNTKAEELREVYTGVSDKVGQVQKLYLALPDREQTYFRRWLKSQLSATVDKDITVEELIADAQAAKAAADTDWVAEAPAEDKELCSCPRYTQPHAPQPACAKAALAAA
jgi:hypothetical protein